MTVLGEVTICMSFLLYDLIDSLGKCLSKSFNFFTFLITSYEVMKIECCFYQMTPFRHPFLMAMILQLQYLHDQRKIRNLQIHFNLISEKLDYRLKIFNLFRNLELHYNYEYLKRYLYYILH